MINTEPEEQQGAQEQSLEESVQGAWKPAVHQEWQWEKWIWTAKATKHNKQHTWPSSSIYNGQETCNSCSWHIKPQLFGYEHKNVQL